MRLSEGLFGLKVEEFPARPCRNKGTCLVHHFTGDGVNAVAEVWVFLKVDDAHLAAPVVAFPFHLCKGLRPFLCLVAPHAGMGRIYKLKPRLAPC